MRHVECWMNSKRVTYRRPCRRKPAVQDYNCFKTLQLCQSHEHCVNCQLWALSRMSFKLGYPINAKKSQRFCKTSLFEFGQVQKWPFLTSYKNEKNHVFLPQVFVQKSPLQNQKSTIIVKFSPCSSLEGSDFFVLFRFQGQTTVFCSSASRPCLDFQHRDCSTCWEIARIFDCVRSFPNFGVLHICTSEGGSSVKTLLQWLISQAESREAIFCLFLFLGLYIVTAAVRKSFFNLHRYTAI